MSNTQFPTDTELYRQFEKLCQYKPEKHKPKKQGKKNKQWEIQNNILTNQYYGFNPTYEKLIYNI